MGDTLRRLRPIGIIVVATVSVAFILSSTAVLAQEEVTEEITAETTSEEVMEATESTDEPSSEESMEKKEETFVESTDEMEIASFGGLHFAAGNIIRTAEHIDGDLFAAGYKVDVQETIAGDVFAAGQDIIIDEAVDGDIRVAGNTITIDAPVSGSVMAFGSTVMFTENAIIDGHITVAAASVEVMGTVKKQAAIGGAFVELYGTFEGPVEIEAENTYVKEGTVLLNTVDVRSPNEPDVEDGVEGADAISYEFVDYDEYNSANEFDFDGFFAGSLFFAFMKFITFLVLGAVVLLLFPTATKNVVERMESDWQNSLLGGLLVLILTPIVAVLIGITIIGLPLMGTIFMVYGLAAMLASIYVSISIGKRLFKNSEEHTGMQKVLHFGVGLLLLSIVTMIPLIGWFVSVVAIAWGIGGLWKVVMEQRK